MVAVRRSEPGMDGFHVSRPPGTCFFNLHFRSGFYLIPSWSTGTESNPAYPITWSSPHPRFVIYPFSCPRPPSVPNNVPNPRWLSLRPAYHPRHGSSGHRSVRLVSVRDIRYVVGPSRIDLVLRDFRCFELAISVTALPFCRTTFSAV